MNYVQKKPKGARTLVVQGQPYYWLTGEKFTKIYGPDKSRAVLNCNLLGIPAEEFDRANRNGLERHGAVQPNHIEHYIRVYWFIGTPQDDEEERKDALAPQYEYMKEDREYPRPYESYSLDDMTEDEWREWRDGQNY